MAGTVPLKIRLAGFIYPWGNLGGVYFHDFCSCYFLLFGRRDIFSFLSRSFRSDHCCLPCGEWESCSPMRVEGETFEGPVSWSSTSPAVVAAQAVFLLFLGWDPFKGVFLGAPVILPSPPVLWLSRLLLRAASGGLVRFVTLSGIVKTPLALTILLLVLRFLGPRSFPYFF